MKKICEDSYGYAGKTRVDVDVAKAGESRFSPFGNTHRARFAKGLAIKKIFIMGLFILCVGCASQGPDSWLTGNFSKSSEEYYREGNRYAKGLGVPRDYAKATEYYRKSADMGNSNAQDKLGMRYLLGQGVPQDYDKAKMWFEKSAAKGNAYAENQLGYMYASGTGVPQNYQMALEWYQKSADHGLASAQYNLGLMYANGVGTSVDKVKAKKFLALSAAQGFDPAKEALNQLN